MRRVWPVLPVAAVIVGCALVSGSRLHAAGQSYTSGQPVWPAFEGWEKNDDGSANFVFGYMNDNWSEELDVPIGAENGIEPGGPDRGQPTHFQPRRNRFMFRVRVPKDWTDKEMVWTLATHGVSRKAYASMRADLQIENIDIMSETGALGAGTSNPQLRADQPPVVKIVGSSTLTATVGSPLTLTAIVTDDGVPAVRPRQVRPNQEDPNYRPPARLTVGKNLGLHLSWFVYRGAGTVTFDPRQVKTWEDTRAGANSPWAPIWSPPSVPPEGKYIVTATFDQPGIYVLRARADDGALTSDEDVTVTVSR
ncbi:MAG TPA: hypothetical protein VNZ26_10140 [Vicinamibacterales bacterium]|nr:hypothetical protein [Vicinamibacterales bacterium]